VIVETSTIIARPIDAVFGYAADPRNWPRYSSWIVAATMHADGSLRQGAAFEMRGRFLGRQFTNTCEIVHYERGHRLLIRTTTAEVHYQFEYLYEPVASGTRYSVRATTDAIDFFRLAEPIFARIARRQLMSDAAALKQLLEHHPSPSADSARLIGELKEQQQRFNSLIATVPGVVWEAWEQPDPLAQRSNFVSDYVESMLGYRVEHWLAHAGFWLTVVHQDDRARVSRELAALFAAGREGSMQFRWLTSAGRTLWVEARIVPILDTGGRSLGMRGVALDISERVETARKLEVAHEREQQLQSEVQQLRIEIDEARAARQLATIVETDYFQELQRKTADLRLRANSGGGPGRTCPP
jgi:PAS domain S-box-containing protein